MTPYKHEGHIIKTSRSKYFGAASWQEGQLNNVLRIFNIFNASSVPIIDRRCRSRFPILITSDLTGIIRYIIRPSLIPSNNYHVCWDHLTVGRPLKFECPMLLPCATYGKAPQHRGIHGKDCHILFTIDQLCADSPPSNSYLLRPGTWRSFHSRVHSETDFWSCTNGLTRLAGVVERLGIFNFASRCLVRVPRTN